MASYMYWYLENPKDIPFNWVLRHRTEERKDQLMTRAGADGKTPVGPPRAIEVTLTLRHAGTQGGEAKEKTFVHVVAVAAANAQPTEAGASSTGGTTGGSP